MDKNKPMTLLLIEDDVAECIKFKDCTNSRNDINFIGMTGSSIEGIQFVKNRLPEGIILDLELHKGKGSGLLFLEEIRGLNIGFKPIIIVTTNSPSAIVYNHVHDMGVDIVFYKRQLDYSADMVINTLLTLRKSLHNVTANGIANDLQTIESPEEIKNRIMERINTELKLIGISSKHKGLTYLQEAIFLLVNKDNNSSETIINQVCTNNKLAYSSVTRAIQTAINRTWASTSIEDLMKHYTARINFKTGVPTPIEFIYYYAEKIRKSM